MNFTIKSLKIFRTLQKIIQLDLVPSNFNPLILIKCPISASIRKQNHKQRKKNRFIRCPSLQTQQKNREVRFPRKSELGQEYNKLERKKKSNFEKNNGK